MKGMTMASDFRVFSGSSSCFHNELETKNPKLSHLNRGTSMKHNVRLSMPAHILPVLFLATAMCVAANEIRIHGGRLHCDGVLKNAQVTVDNGAILSGNGIIDGPATIAGILSPGNSFVDIGALSFNTTLTFIGGSVYECYAEGDTELDKVTAGGAVTGVCEARIAKAPGAIPLNQVIVDGGGASDYADFYTDGASSTNWGLRAQPVGDLLLTDLRGDTDGDGLPDWWEALYFGNRTNADAEADSDNDGIKNRQEYVAGTYPNDGASHFYIYVSDNFLSIPGQNPVICWPSPSNRWLNVAGKRYAVERATNLMAAFTVAAMDVAATPPENRFTNSWGADTSAFYRVRVQP